MKNIRNLEIIIKLAAAMLAALTCLGASGP